MLAKGEYKQRDRTGTKPGRGRGSAGETAWSKPKRTSPKKGREWERERAATAKAQQTEERKRKLSNDPTTLLLEFLYINKCRVPRLD